MHRALEFARQNVIPVALGIGLIVAGLATFPYLLGLSGALGGALAVLVLAASLVAYRMFNRSRIVWSQPLSPGRFLAGLVTGLAVIGLVIQLVPYGRDRSNPPVTMEPAWDSPRTRELVVRACFNCHSNEVEYPWYSRIAPASWAVQTHVQQARDKVNYSEWDKPQDEAEESAETVSEGEMPPGYFTRLAHPGARLTDGELSELIAGLESTFESHDGDD